MDGRFVVKMTITEAACLPLSRVILKQKRARRSILVRWVLVALCAGFAVLNAVVGQWALVAVMVVLGAAMAAVICLTPKMNAKRMFTALNPDLGEMVYTFTDQNVHVVDALEDGDIQYTSFVRLVETREQFLLFRGEYQANILPLAGFLKGAPEDFRTFIQEKTGRTYERVEA